MNDWGWRFALVAMAFAWWALLTQPREETHCYGCMCEHRYFNPASMLEPVRWPVKSAEGFAEAWASPEPKAFLFNPECAVDGTLLIVIEMPTEI